MRRKRVTTMDHAHQSPTTISGSIGLLAAKSEFNQKSRTRNIVLSPFLKYIGYYFLINFSLRVTLAVQSLYSYIRCNDYSPHLELIFVHKWESASPWLHKLMSVPLCKDRLKISDFRSLRYFQKVWRHFRCEEVHILSHTVVTDFKKDIGYSFGFLFNLEYRATGIFQQRSMTSASIESKGKFGKKWEIER